uniref:CS domain-containing protein n=1 Tax=Arion vulgaris TaxID=1028688 RepID=A0A0B7ADY9_9EUPU
MAEAAVEPDYAADERAKEGYVRLRVKIGGLKVKSPGIFNRILHKHPHPEGKNAEIEVPTFHDKGFELNVRGGTAGEMKGAHYSFKILQLPFDIEADDCYITAEDGWINMFLKKTDVNQSWEKHIRDNALETASMD